MSYFVIPNTSSIPEWEKIFTFLLSCCDKFQITFPSGDYDQENPLLGGKSEFENIKGITITASEEMNEAIMVTAKLNDNAKQLFAKMLQPSYIGYKSELWGFRLYKKKQLFITVSDFNVALIEKTPTLLLFLEKEGIQIK
ncbi:MAG: hypothetical protein ACI35O_15165 [Bacillaceae bacterium]